jgi:hypothetical protein
MTWVWMDEHWEEVVPYSIASLLLMILIFLTLFFWFRGPVEAPVEVIYKQQQQPQVVVVEVPKADHGKEGGCETQSSSEDGNNTSSMHHNEEQV